MIKNKKEIIIKKIITKEIITKEIAIGERKIGGQNPCFVVAEAGWNYDGKLEQAKQMIDMVAEAGCDAIKFQSFTADKLFNEYLDYAKKGQRKDWIELVRSMELPKEWYPVLADYCKEKGIVFFSSVCDEEKVDCLNELNAPVFKVPSYELTHIPLLKYIAKKGKPIILSSGIANEKEIEEAINAVYQEGNKNVILMHCVSAYPTKFEELNLKTIPFYKKRFGIPVGLSDHSLGFLSSQTAVALGADIVEKHITLDKTLPGADHHFSLDKKEIKEWVSRIRETESALGGVKKEPASGEKNEIFWRRAVWAKQDIPKGRELTEDMLMIVRPSPAGSLEPKRIYEILGREVKKDIRKGELITWDKLSERR